MRKLNLIGERYGRWYVIEESEQVQHPGGSKHRRFLCQCDCGNKKLILMNDLRSGKSKSCGCLQKEIVSQSNLKHGHNRTGKPNGTYVSWGCMIQRCTNPKNKHYKDYGERGIKVWPDWLDNYTNFLTDMGERPEGTTLDRIDNDGDYTPDNCRWATYSQQSNNYSRNILIHYKDSTMTIKQFSDKFNVSYSKVYRLYKTEGLPVDEIVSRMNILP